MLLSGSNADGVDGLIKATSPDALIMVQDPASAEFPVMPQASLNRVKADIMVKKESLDDLSALFQ